jgi:hypothetical protein
VLIPLERSLQGSYDAKKAKVKSLDSTLAFRLSVQRRTRGVGSPPDRKLPRDVSSVRGYDHLNPESR